jgi:hypothetical protein
MILYQGGHVQVRVENNERQVWVRREIPSEDEIAHGWIKIWADPLVSSMTNKPLEETRILTPREAGLTARWL